jgi:hypothetical protein
MRSDAFSTETTTTPMPLGIDCLQFAMNWQMAVGRSLWLAQRQQWEMMAMWPRSACAVRRELMDQWACRFGGGVPLDG